MAQVPRTVSDIMTRDIVTLYETQKLVRAGEEMSLFGFRHMPVVDGETLVGLVTHRDLLRFAIGPQDAGGTGRRAGDIMTRGVQTVSPQTPLIEAGRLMKKHKYGCLPVVQDGKLVGLVTEADFVDLAVHLLSRQPSV